MKICFVSGLIALLLGSAVPAAATVSYEFQLSGSRSATFNIGESRKPSSFTANQTFFAATPGTYAGTPGTADISFSTSFFGGTTGGFEAINLGLLGFSQFVSSEVLFTGTTAKPLFKNGVFGLTSIVSGASTLVITQAIGMPSTVPEPATWAMLLTGMGLIGCFVRRRPAAS